MTSKRKAESQGLQRRKNRLRQQRSARRRDQITNEEKDRKNSRN